MCKQKTDAEQQTEAGQRTEAKQRFEDLQVLTYIQAFNLINKGNGIFTPVSIIVGEELRKQIMVKNPQTWHIHLESIQTSGSGIWSLEYEDDDQITLAMTIFKVPHVAYEDLIFMAKGQSLLYCDLQNKEAHKCEFVKYERRSNSHYVTIIINGAKEELHCTDYGKTWACFPNI